MSDNDVAMRIVERRLELAEVLRSAPKEPAAAAVQARRHEWELKLGGADVNQLLRQAGMTEKELDLWMRDDVRIAAYVDVVFGAKVAPTRADMLAYYDQHRAEFTKGGVEQGFDAASPEVKRRLEDTNRAALVKPWIESLVRRADVRDAR
jgi:hypothetical protein